MTAARNPVVMSETPAERFASLSVDELALGENIRFALHEIEDLAADIRRRGVLQPIVVIPNEDGDGAEVLIGHRRLAAAKLAGLDKIPCVLRPRELRVNRLLDQVAENSQRLNLTPIEEATCCAELLREGLTAVQIGVQMHRSDTWVNTRLRLLDAPQCLQDAVHNGSVTTSRAVDVLPQLKNEDDVRRLEGHLNDRAGDGLGGWWRETYAMRARAEEHAERKASEAAPRPAATHGFMRFRLRLDICEAVQQRAREFNVTPDEWLEDLLEVAVDMYNEAEGVG